MPRRRRAKKITTFAGNGTALTSDEKLWRNGKLTALREISARYGELRDEGYSFYLGQAKATKHGSYLLNAEDSSGNPKAYATLPMQVVSRDKFLAGSFRIPESYTELEMEFAGHENLGRYGDLLGDGTTKIFNSVEELLTSPPAAQPGDQKVWFVKDPSDPQKIHFYTCYTTIGKVQIKLHLNNGGSAQPSLVTHQLKAAPDFAKVISYVDRWVKGSSFTGTAASTTWLAMNTTNIVGDLANQTRACLIPFFDIIDQVYGFTPLVMGLCDGVRMGLKDDKEFLALIANGTVNAGGWVLSHAAAEISGWSGDPDKRVEELKKILHDLCTKVVMPSLTELGENFTTWEGFRDKAWNAWHKTWKRARDFDLALKVVPAQAAQWLIESLTAWGDDFCTRMMSGAEKSAWSSTQWDTGPLLSEDLLYRNQAYYTFGYTLGYLGEQCATAAISAGTITVAKIVGKNGISMIGKLGPRALGALGVRLNYLKEALANGPLLDDGLRLAYDGMMSSAAREPISPLIKEVPLTMMENRMAGQGFNRLVYNYKEWVKFAVKDGNIRKLVKIPGRQGQFARACAKWMHIMGVKATATASKGWVPFYDRLLKFENGNFIEDRAEDFFKLMKLETDEGKEAARKSLEDYAARVTNDPNAKFWFKDVEKVQAEGYRYSNFDPRFDKDLNPVPGPPKLGVHEGDGWYVGFEKIDSSATTKSRFQLPGTSSAKYRLEFDWEAVNNNVKVPRGDQGRADFFEPLCRDFPENGVGEGAQVLVDGSEVPIKAIWDISGSVPIKIYPNCL